jgi:hypothetical protein
MEYTYRFRRFSGVYAGSKTPAQAGFVLEKQNSPELNLQGSLLLSRINYSFLEKSSLPTPHSGHSQSAGTSSQAVPGSTPLSGSPSAGS